MLKELREQKGISQKELSEKTNISIRTIQSYEQNWRDINGANLKTLLSLCKALDCTLLDILTDEELISLIKEKEAGLV